jgi:hypothetical protein
MRKWVIAVVASGVVTFGAAGARADLVGSYEGKLACAGIESGQPSREKQEVTAQISDVGSGRLALRVSGLEDFQVFVTPVTGIPVSGFSSLAGISCSLDADLVGATVMATGRERNGKAAIKGLVIRMSQPQADTVTCKLALKRVSTTDPALTLCPTTLTATD